MMYELQPCPFCGGKNIYLDKAFINSVPLIYCPDCTAVVSFGKNKRDSFKKSAELYNTRRPIVSKE